MGDFARQVLLSSSPRKQRPDAYVQYSETEIGAILDQAQSLNSQKRAIPDIPVFDEYREEYDGDIEYRYADFPLAIGSEIIDRSK